MAIRPSARIPRAYAPVDFPSAFASFSSARFMAAGTLRDSVTVSGAAFGSFPSTISPTFTHPLGHSSRSRAGLVSACLLWWPHHKRQAFARCARLQDLGSVYTNAGLPASAHALPSWFPRPRNAETTRGDTGKERVDGAERPSTLNQVWSCGLTVASIPHSANEG